MREVKLEEWVEFKRTDTYSKQNKQYAQRAGVKKVQHLSKEQWACLAEASGKGNGIHLDRVLSAKLILSYRRQGFIGNNGDVCEHCFSLELYSNA